MSYQTWSIAIFRWPPTVRLQFEMDTFRPPVFYELYKWLISIFSKTGKATKSPIVTKIIPGGLYTSSPQITSPATSVSSKLHKSVHFAPCSGRDFSITIQPISWRFYNFGKRDSSAVLYFLFCRLFNIFLLLGPKIGSTWTYPHLLTT